MNHDVSGGLPLNRPLVWVVDDDADLLAALHFSLETDGYQVRGYATGEALLNNEASPDNPACLIIDQVLPGMSGLELISRLRRKGNASPAILITTHPSVSVRERANKLKTRIVEKPLLGDTLVRAVRDQIAAGGPA